MRTTTKVVFPGRIRALAGLLALLAGLLGCSEKAREGLDPQDEALLGRMRVLAEIRILAQEYPDSAQVELDAFLAHNDTTGMAEEISKLWQDPDRGRFFLQALHDSLQAPLRDAGGGARQPAPDDDGI